MANFSATNLQAGTQQNLSSSFKTLLEIHAVTSGRRGFIYEFDIGIDGTPNATDCSIDWDANRTSAAGTGTSITPNPLDPADIAAASLVVNGNHTAEPTAVSTGNLWSLGANQRASYRWIARDDKSALWIPATSLSGIGIRAKSATYASTAVATAHYVEQ